MNGVLALEKININIEIIIKNRMKVQELKYTKIKMYWTD